MMIGLAIIIGKNQMMFSDRSGDYDGETNSDCSAMFSL